VLVQAQINAMNLIDISSAFFGFNTMVNTSFKGTVGIAEFAAFTNTSCLPTSDS
jgi:hypothetical protein